MCVCPSVVSVPGSAEAWLCGLSVCLSVCLSGLHGGQSLKLPEEGRLRKLVGRPPTIVREPRPTRVGCVGLFTVHCVRTAVQPVTATSQPCPALPCPALHCLQLCLGTVWYFVYG